jgi:O-antigen biosynthesis protein
MSETKNRELYNPNFEFTSELPLESSAWSGHYFFAYDLVANTKPNVIVELGTHKGNSLFSFAQAIKDFNLGTELHGIDTWEGDEHAGFYGEEVYKAFLEIKNKYYKEVDIIPHKMFFDDAVDKFEDNSIDILHIDGLHTYDAVKHDFENWLPKVRKKTGIILFHDVCEKSDDFGVYKLWEDLKKKYKTITFDHYHGLGVLFLNKNPFGKTYPSPELLTKYYKKISEVQDLNKTLNDKDIHINNLEREILDHLKITKELTKQNQELTKQNQELTNQNQDLNSALTEKNKELEKIYTSKSWKLTQPIRESTKVLRDLKKKIS